MSADITPTPADGIMAILAAAGLNPAPWQMQVGQITDQPDQLIMLRNTGGLAGEIALAIDYPSVQIIVRGPAGEGSYSAAWAKMKQIKQALIAIPNGGSAYPELTLCKAKGDIQDLPYDDRKRFLCSFNIDLIVCFDSDGYRE
jgi:hypothetical protein